MEKHGSTGHTTAENMIRGTRFACWITKATETHSEYVVFNAVPRQKSLNECALILGCYVHCLSCYVNSATEKLKSSGIDSW